MIVTITPNPSIDRTISVKKLKRGAVHRAIDSREDPGGKGLNVSRALAQNGTATIAVLPIGGASGQMMLDLLRHQELAVRAVPISGGVRINIAVVEPDGTTTKLNEAGPRLSAGEVAALYDATFAVVDAHTRWVVGCGSLPPGAPVAFFADLVRRCRDAGVRVAVDSSGEPMSLALAASPDLVKPNRIELAEVVGRPLGTVGEVVAAARDLVAGGIRTVVVSLGRDGALLVDAGTAIHAQASVSNPLSTVGAGDSLLAGYLHASAAECSGEEALRAAVAFGAAAVQLPGSQMPMPADVSAVPVTFDTSPDFDRPLDD